MKKSHSFILVIFLVTLQPFNLLAWEYPTNATGYPYASSLKDQVDQWNTYTRNCTSYVMWKINQSGIPFHNNPTGPNGNTVTMGNAGSWDENAVYIGYSVDEIPSAGNPVSWEPYSVGAGPVGHIAWVERVNANGTVFLSEWNWNGGDGNYNERNGYIGDHYLHITNSYGSGSSVIQNLTVNSGQSYSCSVPSGGSITILPNTNFQGGSNVNLYIN